jgi:hypothetical protein
MSKIDQLAATVAAQGAEIAALRAQLAAAQPPAPARKIIPARVEEEGLRILVGRDAGEPYVALPSAAELRRLRAIVDEAYPALMFVPRNQRYAASDAAEDWRGFVAAFHRLAQLGRSDKLAASKAVSWHVDDAATAMKTGDGADINGRNFIAALVAHGDVAFTPLHDYPVFGLTFAGAGRRYSERWREVLATGRVLPTVAKPGPPAAPPSPVQISIGGWQG